MDPYQVLGLPPTATLDDAEDAYRRLLRQHHPDLHQRDGADALAAAERRTQALNTAIGELRAIPRSPWPGWAAGTDEADLPQVACPLCGEWFSTAPALKAHVTAHHDLRLDRRLRRRRPRRATPPLPVWMVLPFNGLAALVAATVANTWSHDTVLAAWVFALAMSPSVIRLVGHDDLD